MATKRVKVVNHLPQFINERQRRAVTALTRAVVRIGSELPAVVPVDTSTLLNSQYREVNQDGDKLRGRIGFTAEYAAAVHAAEGKLKGQMRPKRDGKGRGKFWGPHDGQPKFLEVAAERAGPDVDSIIKKAIKA